jgi:hypothetical protein
MLGNYRVAAQLVASRVVLSSTEFVSYGTKIDPSSNRREKRNVYKLLVGNPEGRRPLGRPRRRWIDNIKMDLLEMGVSVVDWIGLAQDRYRWRALVNSVMSFRVP